MPLEVLIILSESYRTPRRANMRTLGNLPFPYLIEFVTNFLKLNTSCYLREMDKSNPMTLNILQLMPGIIWQVIVYSHL
jgi:hypothetical protein